MGMLRKLGGVLAYPYTRTVRDIRSATTGVTTAFRQTRDLRERQRRRAEIEQGLLTGNSPQERFEELYVRNGWDPDQLAAQKIAARRSRIALLVLAGSGFLSLLGMMFFVPWIIVALLGPIAIVLLAGCTALAARFAWWEYQIDSRSLVTMRAFLGRADLFVRVLT